MIKYPDTLNLRGYMSDVSLYFHFARASNRYFQVFYINENLKISIRRSSGSFSQRHRESLTDLPHFFYPSQSSLSPSYKLYALILHSGSGPHSGHYTAVVKSSAGKWFDMNDDLVSPAQSPLGQRNAYCLFYVREKGDQLKEIIAGGAGGGSEGVNGGGKKRKRDSLSSQNGAVTGEVVDRKETTSPVGKKVRPSSPVARIPGPQPPQILTASTPSSPKLSSTNYNPFETKSTSAPSPSTAEPPTMNGQSEAKSQLTDFEKKAQQQRMDKKQQHSHKVKEFLSRKDSTASPSQSHQGSQKGGGGKRPKLVERMKGRNKPKMLRG
jgi:hypothetical protein